jgi:hypothetical protein
MNWVNVSGSRRRVMGTRDLVEHEGEFQVLSNESIEKVKEESAEDQAKAIRAKAEDRVRNVLNLSQGEPLSEAQSALASQYEKVIRGESLTPQMKSPQATNGRFQIDTTGRRPHVKEGK